MDDGLLLWQRIALERGEPTDVPPRQRRTQADSRNNPQVHESAGPTEYCIELPWPRPPLNHNQRHTPWAKGRITAAIREDVRVLAKAAKIPHQDFITVQLHYAPGRRGKRDPMNLTATSKPCIDALVDAGIVADDNTEHLHEETPAIHFPPTPGPRCWLTITLLPVNTQRENQ